MHEAIISVHCLQYIIHTCSSSGFKTRQKIPLSCAVTQTFSRNRKKFQLSGVQVIGSEKQITKHKEVGWGSNASTVYMYHAKFTLGATKVIMIF